MAIETISVPSLKRQYPHVDGVEDWRAQQTIRLLWDRVFDLEARLQGAETRVGDLVAATNRQDDQLAAVSRKADEALASVQTTSSEKAAIEAGTHLPGEAPDVMSTISSVFAAGVPGSGAPWTLTVTVGTAASSSKFVEAVVTTLHGTDARWGHINKTGGQNGSLTHVPPGDGHAVDAICWKNPDGVTAEIYDIVSSSGGLQQIYDTGSRDNGDALANWKYPA